MATQTTQDRKEAIMRAIKAEYKKTADDYKHFVNMHVKIKHPKRGIIPFTMYPFQEQTLDAFYHENRVIILKGRQLGLSTLVAAYIAHQMIFKPNFSAVVIATKQKTAVNLVKKVKLIFKSLPTWYKYFIKVSTDNKLSVELINGSYFVAETSTGDDAARSEALSLLVLDEAAFIRRVDDVWTGAQPTLSTGGQAILLSTPNGVGNLFHDLWTRAILGENEFKPIKLPWYVHPERDQAWRDRQTAEAKSPLQASQENDCDFITSGKSVIDGKTIEALSEWAKPPIEKLGNDDGLWVWAKPVVGARYVISADVATAGGDDFCTAQVLEAASLEQVAEYRGHKDAQDFGKELLPLARHYNNAILAIENNSIGWAAIVPALNEGYENLYWSERGSVEWVDPQTVNEIMDSKKVKAGWSTTTKSRPIIIDNMETMINHDEVNINSARLLEEMRTFVWKNGKAIALDGYHDDLIMAYAIGLWVRNTAFKAMQQRAEYEAKKSEWITQRIGLDDDKSPFFTNGGNENPYELEYGDNREIENLADWL